MWSRCRPPSSLTVMEDLRFLLISVSPEKMSILTRFKPSLASGSRLVLGLLCLPYFSPAQQNKLTVRAAEQITVKRGETVNQTLKVEVLPGFHVNSDKPRDEFLIPLKLTWNPGPLEAKSIEYPKPEEIKVGNDMLLVFTGSFNIETQFKASGRSTPGLAIMTGKLRYQACNSQMCFRPASADIQLPVNIQ